jgi:GNAT superfamily N-acetyltransferase
MQPDREAWIAAGGDPRKLDLYESIGQVAVFSDGDSRVLAGIHPVWPTIGTVGDWVGGDEVRVAAEAWLSERGCKVLRGPMELCSWFPHRVNLGPRDEAPFVNEPTAPIERWTAAGYRPFARWVSALADHQKQIEAATDRMASLSAAGWRLETLVVGSDGTVPEGILGETLAVVHRLSHEAFREQPGFAPISVHALQEIYRPLRLFMDPRLTFLARAPTGDVAGFLFGLPDVPQPDRGWFVIHTLAVTPRWQQAGVGSWLVAAAHRAARKAGYTAGVHALMSAGSPSSKISAYGGRVFREYALLEKQAT